ncbi:MAG: GntR family transcriptional regulator [Thermotogae bacterium]|nr:MAG: GntR family transcriptional regulator [Thermotogota bacterium]
MVYIDRTLPIPVYKQIELQFKKEMLLGRLNKGDQLPPARDLAKRLGVNVNTVLKAYEKLVSDQLVEAKHGIGFFVKVHYDEGSNIVSQIRKIATILKENGVERDLGIMLLQEVWRK